MDKGALRGMIAEIGPMDDLILEIDEMEEDGGWIVRLEAADIVIEHLPQHRQIGLSTVIDGPGDGLSAQAHEMLLAANVMWRENGGVRFALGASDGLIEISVMIAADGVTKQELVSCVTGLAEQAVAWSLLFSGAVPADGDGPIAADFDPA